MCHRYYIRKNEPVFETAITKALSSPLREKFAAALGRPILTEGEIRPTDIAPVIASNRRGEQSAFPMKWGFTLPNGKAPVVNARVESAATKPLFKEAWQKRRCIIPASWYYEWEHFPLPDGKTKTGDRFLIRPKEERLTWLCGIYSFENDLPVFAVLTGPPSETVAGIHDRMPLILPETKIKEWIYPETRPEELLPFMLKDMSLEK